MQCILEQNRALWSSKKRHVVLRSSTTLEYKALALATAEVLWIQALLNELKLDIDQTPVMWYDN